VVSYEIYREDGRNGITFVHMLYINFQRKKKIQENDQTYRYYPSNIYVLYELRLYDY
jgi:hypothetical protein